LKIGFDIDDTLNDVRYTGTRIFNEHLQAGVTLEMVDSSPSVHIYDAFNLSPEEGYQLWQTLQNRIHEETLPLEAAVEALKRLKQNGHEIYYITAREDTPLIREGTINWLQRHGFPFQEDHLFIGMRDEEKAEIAQRVALDLFFDDKPHMLDAFQKTNIKVCIKDTCYNKHAPYRRVSSWSELEKLLDELQNGK
jgi:uncharacterized HAD superfamily protein